MAALRVGFAGANVFITGENGAGKTNLLEALGMVSALRSFRTQDARHLVGWGKREARIALDIEHDRDGAVQVEMRLAPGSRAVYVDGERVARLADYVGRFPTVVMSSQDIQLLRGSPQLRRRFMDLAFASIDGVYFDALRGYHRALKNRNTLLKRGARGVELLAFEREMIPPAVTLYARRREYIANMEERLRSAYAGFASADEAPALGYKPDVAADTEEVFAGLLDENRARDAVIGTTTKGPHRDDFSLGLFDRAARAYGSEGQQRALVLALRFAQFAFIRERTGTQPVILADDILGELDPQRRERFWQGLPGGTQIFATGTSRPAGAPGAWQVFEVRSGTLREDGQAD